MKYNLPERVLNDIVGLAKKHNITKVVLFGSRARGTNSPRSDIDIAVKGGNSEMFCLDLKEKSHTLLVFDIAELDTISSELKKEIERDGVVLYEEAK